MSALLVIALLAAAPEWFRAVQYTPRATALRGCADCQGEPDDVCEVRAGAQLLPLDEYTKQRWPAPGRIALLRPSAENGCAVPAKSLFGTRSAVELAAVRLAAVPPSQPLLDSLSLKAGIRGWPHKPQQRASDAPAAGGADGNLVRLGVICWPSERGWPMPSRDLGRNNPCEWWLLAVKPDGEPDLQGFSFALDQAPFPAGDARWAQAFDRARVLDESILLGAPPPPAATKAPAAIAPHRCGETAREQAATLDRFDQWDLQIRRAAQPSLDRASLTLDSPAWAGHCQEMEVLREALEHQLECTVAVEGACQ